MKIHTYNFHLFYVYIFIYSFIKMQFNQFIGRDVQINIKIIKHNILLPKNYLS